MQRRFVYHSNAVAFGGRIKRPSCEIIDAMGSAVLPFGGGRAEARVENFRWRDVSYRSSHTVVVGSESQREDGVTIQNSLASTTIEGLNIMGVVTADLVVGRLASEYPSDTEELPILPVGSYFVNLRVAGVPVELTPHAPLFQCATLAEIEKGYQGMDTPFVGPDGPASHFKGFLGPRNPPAAGSPLAPYQDYRVLTSLFDEPALRGASFCRTGKGGCHITVPHFGTVFFGELLLTRYTRRLTMLRVEMGSPIEGTLEADVLEGNGHPVPCAPLGPGRRGARFPAPPAGLRRDPQQRLPGAPGRRHGGGEGPCGRGPPPRRRRGATRLAVDLPGARGRDAGRRAKEFRR